MPAARASTLERLAGGVTVITATRRLARELRRRFDGAQAAAGKRAWESANVLPYRAFLSRVWREPGEHGERPLLLNQWQQGAAWESVIGDDIAASEGDVEPLWNTHASAARALDAWRLIHDWNIALTDCADACAASKHRDHQCWLRWAQGFERKCAAHNWLDPARLAARLCQLLAAGDAPLRDALPGKIAFSGFDRLTPQQRSFIDALQNAGVEVEVDAPASERAEREGEIQRRVFHDDTAQWLSAAQWARDKLRANPRATIAIVAPNIAAAAPQIEYALRQILCPQRLIQPHADGGGAPYHISLGAPLDRHPVAAAALVALGALSGRALPAESVSQLILSPFIAAADSESSARCKLAMACRRRLPYQIHFKQLVAALSGGGDGVDAADCPQLLQALRGALALLEDAAPNRRNRAMPASHWARTFNDALDRFGWPGERALNSGEYQAANALRRELHNLATLDLAAPPMRAGDALAWLRRRAAEQPFQVEARGEPVQVLGVSEAAGQRFDALWFGGLVETDWPPAQRPNPFIDLRLQRRAGIAQASTDANRELAEAMQRRLLACAGEVVLSRPVYAGEDVAVEASALFGGDDLSEGEADQAAGVRDATPAAIIRAAAPQLQSLADSRAPKLTARAAGGGVAVIENQAKCPFRAFALHRLGARDLEQNEQGLDAGERGSLIHRALELVWGQIESSAKLGALGEDQLQKIIADAAEQAARRYMVSSGCGERFHQALVRWASDTLSEWLALEKRRGAFTVAAREAETALKINALKLTGKIDRIDRLENGEAALIDYKTGAPDKLHNWAGARPQSPQLPLYAVAQDDMADEIGAVVYAQVRKGECVFSGVARSAEAQFAGQVGAVENHRGLKYEFADWSEMVAHWREVLPQLADEFTAGEARVEPHHPDVCARCHLHTLCRIQTDGGDSR